MAGRPKGYAKTGGRVKGQSNKKTIEQKARAERVLSIIDIDHLKKDIKALYPAERMRLYASMMEFVAPKLQRVDGKFSANINLTNHDIIFDD